MNHQAWCPVPELQSALTPPAPIAPAPAQAEAELLQALCDRIDDLAGPLDPEEPNYYWRNQDMESLGESLYQSDKTFMDEGVMVILAAIEYAQALAPAEAE